MSSGRILVICLTNWSFGEATLGIQLIQNSQYKELHFAISPFLEPLFRYHNIPYTKLIPGAVSTINQLILMSIVQDLGPDEIILADPLTFIESELYYGIKHY